MNKLFDKNLSKLLINFTNHVVTHQTDYIRPASIGWTQMMARRWAGHSKWANIKHTKLAKDAEKSRVINKLLSKLKYSLRQTGGADPKINKEFASVMEMLRRANVANTTIDKCIKRSLEKKFVAVKLEIMGPNGCLLVVEAEAESKGLLRNAIKQVLKKYNGFAFVEEGRAMFAFEEKGVIRVKDTDKSGQQINLEKAEEVAIEADAEEVKPSEDDQSVLEFLTEPINCHKTKKYIEENTNFEVIEGGIELMPYTRVDLPEDILEKVATAIEELEELDEITRVYDNIN